MKYPINIPHLFKEDKKYAHEAIESGWISAQGPFVKKFEKRMADYCGRKYATTISNGSCALLTAVKSLKLPPKSEVILPATTFISCYNAIVQAGLVPVICDVDLHKWTICPFDLQRKITPKTKAIMVVDLYGLMVNTEKIQAIAKHHNLKIIEDAAEAHGASHLDVKAGGFGDVSIFSFYSNKIITTGEGGMLLTDDEDIFEEALAIKNSYFDDDRRQYNNTNMGYNFRFNNVAAALGVGQLENINYTIKRRKEIAHRYNFHFNSYPFFQTPFEDAHYKNVFWYYSLLINDDLCFRKTRALKNNIIKNLELNKIDYRHFFKPLHKQPFIDSKIILPVSEFLYAGGLNLPTYTQLKDKDIDFISNVIKEVLYD
tara:strand:+ start:2640 stop:3755 length:1116 start_codon:yes stop_codon:yes gene_type:complete